MLNLKSKSSGRYTRDHRFLVITRLNDSDNYKEIKYSGVLFSSKVEDKSNKYFPDKFPNNLYFDNLKSILVELPAGGANTNPGFVNVSEVYTFTYDNIHSKSGYWKGRVNNDFLNFVKLGIENYESGN